MERKTKIIATLGPSSSSHEVITGLAPYIDYARLNFSWGTHDEMKVLIDTVRSVSQETGRKILVIQDLSGPRQQETTGHHIASGNQAVLTNKDLKDLEFGIMRSVDYVAMSYVGSATDILSLRNHMAALGTVVPIIAKIETKEAIANMNEILDVSDMIMIARGDLGQAFPIEEIPQIEKNILSLCKEKNKFVIVATEVLLSMVKADRPTRAEVTDVDFAVSEGANAIMLSEETAIGDHPIAVVMELDTLIRYADAHPLQ